MGVTPAPPPAEEVPPVGRSSLAARVGAAAGAAVHMFTGMLRKVCLLVGVGKNMVGEGETAGCAGYVRC